MNSTKVAIMRLHFKQDTFEVRTKIVSKQNMSSDGMKFVWQDAAIS
jgi:hypothetical protein